MTCVAAAFRALDSYPEIQVEGKNLLYAWAMPNNMEGGTSEIDCEPERIQHPAQLHLKMVSIAYDPS